ncbi:hypothetical protein B0H16DRAFT_1687270 [Mycena metata]|uniref:Uncharacterized protein n=1 Tax=Mycena metata TaxID=1033252 RepID=A0AAD7JL50_9AGAR|nr:hypothetical protein B0H16DRAFT_1687270 [Mycena metata]
MLGYPDQTPHCAGKGTAFRPPFIQAIHWDSGPHGRHLVLMLSRQSIGHRRAGRRDGLCTIPRPARVLCDHACDSGENATKDRIAGALLKKAEKGRADVGRSVIESVATPMALEVVNAHTIILMQKGKAAGGIGRGAVRATGGAGRKRREKRTPALHAVVTVDEGTGQAGSSRVGSHVVHRGRYFGEEGEGMREGTTCAITSGGHRRRRAGDASGRAHQVHGRNGEDWIVRAGEQALRVPRMREAVRTVVASRKDGRGVREEATGTTWAMRDANLDAAHGVDGARGGGCARRRGVAWVIVHVRRAAIGVVATGAGGTASGADEGSDSRVAGRERGDGMQASFVQWRMLVAARDVVCEGGGRRGWCGRCATREAARGGCTRGGDSDHCCGRRTTFAGGAEDMD